MQVHNGPFVSASPPAGFRNDFLQVHFQNTTNPKQRIQSRVLGSHRSESAFLAVSLGGSTGFWLSNAGNASTLGGAFDQWNFNLVRFSFSFAQLGDTWIVGLTFGPGTSKGASVSKFPATTFNAGGISIGGHADNYVPDK